MGGFSLPFSWSRRMNWGTVTYVHGGTRVTVPGSIREREVFEAAADFLEEGEGEGGITGLSHNHKASAIFRPSSQHFCSCSSLGMREALRGGSIILNLRPLRRSKMRSGASPLQA